MNLHLPQFTATPEEIDQSPNTLREIKQWITDLPLVNMGESTRVFFHTIKILNRQYIPPRTRFGVLESLHPTSRIIINHLNKHLTGLSHPLSAKNRKIVTLMQAILLEMSVGYKHIIHDVSSNDEKLNRKSLILSIYRAMRCLEESMAKNAATYRADTQGSWHDLHRLLAYAEVHKLSQEPIEEGGNDSGKQNASIEDVYKQACLLSMTQPLRLRSGEADKLRKYFETACHLCEMKKALTEDSAGFVHVVSLKSSEPPAYVPLADISAFSNLRGFNLSRMLSTLNDMLKGSGEEQYRPGFSSVYLEPQLVQRLIKTWTTQEKRRFNRDSTKRELVCAIGIKNIIEAINADTNPELTKEELFGSSVDPTETGNEFGHKLIDPISAQPTVTNNELAFGTAYSATTPYDSGLHNTGQQAKMPDSWINWQVSNTGAGGFGLKWSAPTPSLAQVSEIIALREKEYDVHHWRIGIIRWMRNTPESELEIGVQLIAPRAVVVSIEAVHNRTNTQVLPIDALMLPGMKTIKQHPSLLTTNGAFAIGDTLSIAMLGKNMDIELKKIGENPSFYTQFFYKSTQVAETVTHKEEFEDLWNRL